MSNGDVVDKGFSLTGVVHPSQSAARSASGRIFGARVPGSVGVPMVIRYAVALLIVFIVFATTLVGSPPVSAGEVVAAGVARAEGLPKDDPDTNNAGVLVGVVLVVGWATAGAVMFGRARRTRQRSGPTTNGPET